MKAALDFYFDFSSPYSYIASEWVEALAARHGRPVNWHALLVGAAFQVTQIKSPVDYPLKREYVLRDFARSAHFEGLPYRQPTRFPIPTLNAARLFWWLQASDPMRAAAWAHAGLRALFTRDVDLSDPAQLAALAGEFGIEAGEAERAWSDPQVKAKLKAANDAAVAAGVFGVPYFVVDNEPFWGNDRRPQIERWLERGPF